MPLSQQAQDAIDKITADCEPAPGKIAAQQQQLGIRLNQIENKDKLTDADQAEVDKLNAALDALADNDDELSEVTLEALNDSDAVKDMAATIKAANADLQAKLNAVKKTAQQLEQVKAFLAALDGIVQNLTKLAAFLG